jgi:HSP20 family protein
MNVVTWRPFGDLMSVRDSIERVFGDSLVNNYDKDSELTTWHPLTDIYETKDDYVFKVEVPGLKKEDVKVELNNNVLAITGEKKVSDEINKESFHRTEISTGKFSRSFNLPKNIDSKKIDAKMKEGILELKVGKLEEVKPKEISISIH